MLRVTKGKSETKKRSRFTGICADAEVLGVSREHLFRVLTGERQSRSLMRRYLELKQPGAVKAKPDAKLGHKKRKAKVESTSPAEPVPAAGTRTTTVRELRRIRDVARPGDDAINEGAGAGTVRTGKERPGQISLQRAPA
jgi:hypothetical protein